MAVWQAKLHAVLPQPVPGGWWNWSGLPGLRTALSGLFGPEEPEFDGQGLHWGPYARHDARLWLEDDDDEEDGTMCVRLDLRNLEHAFVQALAALLSEAGLRLRLEDGSLVDPTESRVVALVRESRAAHFMDDPWACLRSLSPEDSGPSSDPAS